MSELKIEVPNADLGEVNKSNFNDLKKTKAAGEFRQKHSEPINPKEVQKTEPEDQYEKHSSEHTKDW